MLVSSPRNWKSLPLPAPVALEATAAHARTASARAVSTRCFISDLLVKCATNELPDLCRSPPTRDLAHVRRRKNVLVPGRRVVHPAAADHRRHDLCVEVVPRVAVEHDQVG